LFKFNSQNTFLKKLSFLLSVVVENSEK